MLIVCVYVRVHSVRLMYILQLLMNLFHVKKIKGVEKFIPQTVIQVFKVNKLPVFQL